ncbi:interleukin-4 receptor subunit alpha [Peromyscus maniculatus bairdii]|uniref:Interleukin 4 receptor, alpha n=1 Tax=Peromyscus maniculatus bairdii TaxID=230844 RepID=A0A6J0DF48_PERMB|nr:interleukin-4 receptor subunit alpha isoform X1 [Peromyscus maniculatus bairdii]XP_042139222.1 interleukin-4 receptor subunit alpha isoform X1 [Peromyscus maniculatus bairdii]
MGWLCPKFLSSVSCLILLWVAGSGGIKLLGEPTCFSDYIRNSTCEWPLEGAVDCSSQLHLLYWLDFEFSENHTCIPENSASTTCVCHMSTDEPVQTDIYKMVLRTKGRLLWYGSFRPSSNVKPLAPDNLTVHTNVSNAWLLTWSNPYPSKNTLYKELIYMVNISRVDNPEEFIIHNVTYMEPRLLLPTMTLKSGVHYRARVRVLAQSFSGTWSEWSPSIIMYNHFPLPLEQRLPLGVGISCACILFFCLLCYFSIIKIKKAWWDQIPTPACSPLVAIIIQDSQVPLWEKQTRSRESTKCPRWKTCLAKLLPCLLEHGLKKEAESLKAAKTGPLQSPEKAAWRPVEVSRTVLWPENVNVSVIRCMGLFEAPVETEEEEEEMVKGDVSVLPENSAGGFQEGQADIMARLTENLFSDLLEAEDGVMGQSSLGQSCSPLPSESEQASVACDRFPMGSKEATCQATGQSSHPGPPSGSPAHSAADPACTQVPLVITDNPAYRSFSDFCSQPPHPGELASEQQQAGRLEEGDPPRPADPPSSSPPVHQGDSWEQILHLSVLQHGAASPAPAPTSGYREFAQAVKQGAAQDSRAPCFGPSGTAGYKAFSSLLGSSEVCADAAGPRADSGHGGYKPFQNPVPNQSPHSVPLFTFGLDMELPSNPLNSVPPSSTPECLGLELGLKGGDRLKAPPPADQVPKPFGDDLGLGIVYSSLTCHLCGHLKQHHSQEEGGQIHVVASPCCGCCCGDRSPSPGSLSGTLEPCPGEMPPDASLTPAPRTPSNLSVEGKTPGHAPFSSQTAEVSAGTLGMAVS